MLRGRRKGHAEERPHRVVMGRKGKRRQREQRRGEPLPTIAEDEVLLELRPLPQPMDTDEDVPNEKDFPAYTREICRV